MPPKKVAAKPPAKKAATAKSPVKKAALEKSPAKKPAAKKATAKSPAKKAPTKSPAKEAATPKSAKKETLKAKDLRGVIPKEVPTDIVNLISDYLHEDVREAAHKLYEKMIPTLFLPGFVDEETFVEAVTDKFIKRYGSNFKSFMKKYKKDIEKYGEESFGEIVDELDADMFPKEEHRYGDAELSFMLIDFVTNLLRQMAIKEKYIKKDDNIYVFMESLKIKK